MANLTWTNPFGGNWASPVNWNPGEVPEDGDNIVLPTLTGAYTSVDDLPFIDGINLSIGDSVTLIIAEGDTSVENINAFGTNSFFETQGNAIVSISNGLGGTYAVDGPTASLDITSFNGVGTFDLFSGTVNFGNNANLSGGNSFNFEGDSNGELTIASQNNYQNGWSFPVTGFGLLDTIALGTSIFAPGTYSTAYDPVAHTLTIPKAGGGNYIFNNFTIAAGAPTTFDVTATSITDVVCFLAGTQLRTPAGEVAVERLRTGQQVTTLVDGQEVTQTVRWMDHRRIDLTQHPRPETVSPIRIERDAFADNMPHRVLFVSPDHAIFVDGKLICARQLVNGTTIRRETGWTSVDYFHVELDAHAILLAEGLPAESYLDTGNRGFFANSGAPLVLHPDLTDETDHPTRETASCAPFVSDEAGVQPVWQRLADRAGSSQRMTTTDADPRLLVDQRTIKPVFSDDDRVIFALPRGAREVRLVSRAQSPTEARPWLSDQRRLGVRVKRIVLRHGDETREVPMDHPDIARGWWDIEHDGPMMSRWTDGAALLRLPPMHGIAMLEVHLSGAMTYAIDAASESVTERRAAA